MSRLVEEVYEWNTPIISAYLIWKFTQGYESKHPNGKSPMVLLLFIAEAIMSSNDLSKKISGRRSGLPSYVRSFTENKNSDILAQLHTRILMRRKKALIAIEFATEAGLLVWDFITAELHSKNISNKKGTSKFEKNIKSKSDKAKKLGEWFAVSDINTITSYLGIKL